MEKKHVAEKISIFFNPALISLPATIIALQIHGLSTMETAKFGIAPFIIIASSVYILQNYRYSDLDMNIRNERTKFYPPGLAVIGLTALTIHLSESPALIKDLSNAIIALGLTNGFINLRTKISLHTAGIGAISGLFTALNPSYGLIVGLLVLPVGWARIELGRHTLVQAVSGFSVAFLLVYFFLVF